MSFSDIHRNVAIQKGRSMEIFYNFWPIYKETLSDGVKDIETICAHWDDINHTRKRAASLHDGTIKPINLSDERELWIGLWQSDLEQLVLNGEIEDVEILTDEEVQGLLPEIEL